MLNRIQRTAVACSVLAGLCLSFMGAAGVTTEGRPEAGALAWCTASGLAEVSDPAWLHWSATISEAFGQVERPDAHVRIVSLRTLVLVGPIVVRNVSTVVSVDLLSSDPVSVHIEEASITDALEHAADTMGLELADGIGATMPTTVWRLLPTAGKTWADVTGQSDLVMLQAER